MSWWVVVGAPCPFARISGRCAFPQPCTRCGRVPGHAAVPRRESMAGGDLRALSPPAARVPSAAGNLPVSAGPLLDGSSGGAGKIPSPASLREPGARPRTVLVRPLMSALKGRRVRGMSLGSGIGFLSPLLRTLTSNNLTTLGDMCKYP